MDTGFRLSPALLDDHNRAKEKTVRLDYERLGEVLARRNIAIDDIAKGVEQFSVALPSWGVGTGGTRFARFPGTGEPRGIADKLVDCATVHQLTACTPRVSLHIPWDTPSDATALRSFAASLGLGFDAMNSNTFQDQPGQERSYRYGSLTHTDPAVRAQAIAHNIECIQIGRRLGSQALTVWIGDGGNFPGQVDFRGSLDRYLDSMAKIYAALPEDWKVFVEYKLYEPAFYATVINDWGTALHVASTLGERAGVLVDLGHHAPNVNIEMIVARLLRMKKLGGFHFNDSKYGDDDLDAGSIRPFQLFLIFHELLQGGEVVPAYMIDQSHNVTDPIESLIMSAMEIQAAYARALLVDREALASFQQENDAIMALRTLREAFVTDVSPLLQVVRMRRNGAVDPIMAYRASGYRAAKAQERPAVPAGQAGIV